MKLAIAMPVISWYCWACILWGYSTDLLLLRWAPIAAVTVLSWAALGWSIRDYNRAFMNTLACWFLGFIFLVILILNLPSAHLHWIGILVLSMNCLVTLMGSKAVYWQRVMSTLAAQVGLTMINLAYAPLEQVWAKKYLAIATILILLFAYIDFEDPGTDRFRWSD